MHNVKVLLCVGSKSSHIHLCEKGLLTHGIDGEIKEMRKSLSRLIADKEKKGNSRKKFKDERSQKTVGEKLDRQKIMKG